MMGACGHGQRAILDVVGPRTTGEARIAQRPARSARYGMRFDPESDRIREGFLTVFSRVMRIR